MDYGYWQKQKLELIRAGWQGREALWEMQAQRRAREAKDRAGGWRTLIVKGRGLGDRVLTAISWWFAIPPMPTLRKCRVMRLLYRVGSSDQFSHVEAVSVADALSKLGLPPNWRGSNAELDRHTKFLAELAWQNKAGRALRLWELCWARRMLLDPDLKRAAEAMRRQTEPEKKTAMPRLVDFFRLDGINYVTIGFALPESVLTEWARAEERNRPEDDEEILAPMTAREAMEIIAPAAMRDFWRYLSDLPDIEWPQPEET